MHFLTLVFGDNADAQLAPFLENNDGSCAPENLAFFECGPEYREVYENGIFDSPRDGERHHKLIRDLFPTFEAFMDEEHGPRDERPGLYGDWYNSNAEYDWYEVGGRWNGHLVLKPGRPGRLGSPAPRTKAAGAGRADVACKGDIDFAAMGRECRERFLTLWKNLERCAKTGDRRVKEDCDIPESIVTRAQLVDYAEQRSRCCAPAAVVHNGEWFGPWWAKDELTEAAAKIWDAWFSDLLASFPDETLITVIDCHT